MTSTIPDCSLRGSSTMGRSREQLFSGHGWLDLPLVDRGMGELAPDMAPYRARARFRDS